MGTQAITITLEERVKKLDEAVKEYAIADTFKEATSLSATLKLAEGMISLRELLNKELVDKLLMPLMGSKLGFLTDHDSGTARDKYGPYDWETVRDVSIEAFIRGFQPIDNEWNIIAWGFYATKNGIDRKLRVYKGLTDLERRPGVPVLNQQGTSALVPFTLNYRLEGEPRSFACDVVRDAKDPNRVIADHRVAVRVNNGMGLDAIIGKAHRKASALLLANLTGSVISLPVAEMEDVILTTAEPSPGAPPADASTEKPASAQAQQYQDVLKKHAPANSAAPTPDEAAADERAHSVK